MTENITTQECEREFRAEEQSEARAERRFDEEVRYAPRGERKEPEQAVGAMGEGFFRAALDLSNAIGLLASGELNVAKPEDRLALHQAFGRTENALSQVRRQFYHICITVRRAEDKE